MDMDLEQMTEEQLKMILEDFEDNDSDTEGATNKVKINNLTVPIFHKKLYQVDSTTKKVTVEVIKLCGHCFM